MAKKQPVDEVVYNVHHILWQGRFWDTGWSKKLRTMDYLKVELPRDTLHASIHNQIADIPKPNGQQCKKAYWAILDGLHDGTLSADDDIVKRIDFLLNVWPFDKCPRTHLALRWQQDIILAYYARQIGKP